MYITVHVSSNNCAIYMYMTCTHSPEFENLNTHYRLPASTQVMSPCGVTMWCQLASAAALLGNLLLARKSWEQALCCNDHYWPALEGLCIVLFALEDFYGKAPCWFNVYTYM